ncbi:MAG: hypothetical protein PVJ67_03870 [Candidatus Pacearchaeota archaeon]|jgi:hypothetical protein
MKKQFKQLKQHAELLKAIKLAGTAKKLAQLISKYIHCNASNIQFWRYKDIKKNDDLLPINVSQIVEKIFNYQIIALNICPSIKKISENYKKSLDKKQ